METIKSKTFSLMIANKKFRTVIAGYAKENTLKLGSFSVEISKSRLTPKSLIPRAMLNARTPGRARVHVLPTPITQEVFEKLAKEFGEKILKNLC